MKNLKNWLTKNANHERYLFTPQDLKTLCPKLSDTAFKTMLSRAVDAEVFERICRGLYAFNRPKNGLLLFHAAAYLRRDALNYISLETALSDAGAISQIPLQWITIMSSGRSSTISCGKFGTIEFVHTEQKPIDLVNQLEYDRDCRMWRASIKQAVRDMKITQRNCDLIDWEVVDELAKESLNKKPTTKTQTIDFKNEIILFLSTKDMEQNLKKQKFRPFLSSLLADFKNQLTQLTKTKD